MSRDAELADKAAAIAADPLYFLELNDAQVRFVNAIKNPKKDSLTVVLLLKGNRAGGSYGLIASWSAIMFGTRAKGFQGPPFGSEWPFRKSARLVSPIASLEDRGPLQTAMKELFPKGKYSQSKGSGHGYYSQGYTTAGWTWDAITYDQSSLQAAGANKGVIFMSEPPPQNIFTECITRLSGNGILIAEFTRLDLADFIDEYVDAGALILDGKKVGEVRVVTADIEDSCEIHHHGHQAHSAIEATIAAWPVEEREARRTGKPLKLSGRIYTTWGEANELEALPDYHQKCWDAGQVRIVNVVDPHDRKPWFFGWAACFPNDDCIFIGEWPPFDFYACKSSPVSFYEDYRDIVLETEAQLPKVAEYVMDPMFGEAISTGTGSNLFSLLAGPCRACREAHEKDVLRPRRPGEPGPAGEIRCSHKLQYKHGVSFPGSVNAGHIVVRAAIGDVSKGIRPKLMALKNACPNICLSMRRYAYKENRDSTKGVSENPQLIYKDGADLPRLILQGNFHKWPEETKPVELWKPRTHR